MVEHLLSMQSPWYHPQIQKKKKIGEDKNKRAEWKGGEEREKLRGGWVCSSVGKVFVQPPRSPGFAPQHHCIKQGMVAYNSNPTKR